MVVFFLAAAILKWVLPPTPIRFVVPSHARVGFAQVALGELTRLLMTLAGFAGFPARFFKERDVCVTHQMAAFE